MDDLLHHCLRELAFDGDLGSNPARLKDFIQDFYAHDSSPHTQQVDDDFCAFVWSFVVQQPNVIIGIKPAEVTAEVWIAPQTSAKRKASARGETIVETKPAQLTLLPDAKDRLLGDLIQEYGDDLRLAVTADFIYAAITGSHIRYSQLSPMVYSALQLTTRGRENGISVVELGQKSKYDQKTCFYLVKQLTNLDLVVKVRRGGVGTHFCIHKYFFERSASWQSIREEENRANVEPDEAAPQGGGADLPTETKGLNFTSIDARHLSSLPLVRARVVKLLRASKNHMHPSNNMILAIGFSHPTKTDRRFFQSRVREMLSEGVIEKVVVPNKKKNLTTSISCFRLLEDTANKLTDGGEDGAVEMVERPPGSVKTNSTIHKLITDLLESAGPAGMTLNDLSDALCNFDKRTIELLLTRAEACPPPQHLGDLGISGLMETSGRERRHRYFTVSAYHALVVQENLDPAGLPEVAFETAGGYMSVDPLRFWTDPREMWTFQDEYVNSGGRFGIEEEDNANARRRARAKKTPTADDAKKRPRKKPGEKAMETRATAASTSVTVAKSDKKTGSAKGKRKADEVEDAQEQDDGPAKKRKKSNTAAEKPKGRPGRKKKDADIVDGAPPSVPPKQRGRKKKGDVEKDEDEANLQPARLIRKQGDQSVDEHSSAMVIDALPPTSPVAERFPAPPVAPERFPAPPMFPPLRSGDIESDVSMVGTSQAGPSRVASQADENDANTETVVPSPPGPTISRAVEWPTSHSDDVVPAEGLDTMQTYSQEQGSGGSLEQHQTAGDADNGELEPVQSDEAEIQADQQYTLTSPLQVLVTEQPREDYRFRLVPMDVDAIPQPPSSPPRPPTPPHYQVDGIPIDPALIEEIPSTASVASKLAPAAQKRTNVSHLRRQNELFRVVEILGGIVNTQTKEMFDAHTSLLDSLVQAGETTSAPAGTRTDKRTAMSMLNELEKQGRLKLITTLVPGPAGALRQTVIAHLPDISPAKLNAFLDALRCGSTGIPSAPPLVRKLEESVDYGPDPTLINKSSLPLHLLQIDHSPSVDSTTHKAMDLARVNELFAYDDETIRSVLLTERTTLGQFYGNIVAKALRARTLHLSTVEAFEKNATFPEIISHEHRIVSLNYYCFDLPINLYCTLLSPLFHHDQLTTYIRDPATCKTLVRDLPQSLRSILQIGKSRARSRFLDILELLRCLDLVVPLVQSTSDKPYIQLSEEEKTEENVPRAFDRATMDGWTVSTPTTAPNYWQFKPVAALYHWGSARPFPPLLQMLSVQSSAQSRGYWDALRHASLSRDLESVVSSQIYVPSEDIKVARSLRRSSTWNADYVFSWHQGRYLERFMVNSEAKTPMQLEDGGKELARICHVISAPEAAVRAFYSTAHQRMKKNVRRVKARKNAIADKEQRAKDIEAQKSLAQKTADAKKQREQEWEELIKRVHPGPVNNAAVRLKKLKVKYLQSVNPEPLKWEAEVLKAFEESEAAAGQLLKSTTVVQRTVTFPLPPAIALPLGEKTVRNLIDEQGAPLALVDRQVETKRKKRKRKTKRDESEVEAEAEDEPKKTTRRHRFQWNRDFDELVRDASVIVRARCRNGVRLDWGAFEQVFPSAPRNTVRQRLAYLRTTPGSESYLTRLEQSWYELWLKHRGTTALPDHDFESPADFDLVKHIEFLRKHIDKNALRVGYAQDLDWDLTLPSTVEDIVRRFDIVETMSSAPTWDFLWYAVVEEDREKRMASLPFTRTFGELIDVPSPDRISLAEAAQKMAFGTPNEHYDTAAAAEFLKSVADPNTLSLSSKNLLSRGVFSKLVRDPHRLKAGRQLKISDANQGSLGGPMSMDIFQDAAALEDSFANAEDNSFREWPMVASDGDLAALVQLTSDGLLEYSIDLSGPQAARATLDWNSKKADDDQIEPGLAVKFNGLSIRPVRPPASPSMAPIDIDPALLEDTKQEETLAHGNAVDGTPGCCRLEAPTEIVNCASCLDEQWAMSQTGFSPEEMVVAEKLLWAVGQSSGTGISKADLVKTTEMSLDLLMPVIQRLSSEPIPLLYWVGYSCVILVSAAHVKEWTASLPQEHRCALIFPRRWFDITGAKLTAVWDAAIRAVVGTVLGRPGISQSELRWRLRNTYDRQEVYDILEYLLDEGYVRAVGGHITPELIQTLDTAEEAEVYYIASVGDTKKWYAAAT